MGATAAVERPRRGVEIGNEGNGVDPVRLDTRVGGWVSVYVPVYVYHLGWRELAGKRHHQPWIHRPPKISLVFEAVSCTPVVEAVHACSASHERGRIGNIDCSFKWRCSNFPTAACPAHPTRSKPSTMFPFPLFLVHFPPIHVPATFAGWDCRERCDRWHELCRSLGAHAWFVVPCFGVKRYECISSFNLKGGDR